MLDLLINISPKSIFCPKYFNARKIELYHSLFKFLPHSILPSSYFSWPHPTFPELRILVAKFFCKFFKIELNISYFCQSAVLKKIFYSSYNAEFFKDHWFFSFRIFILFKYKLESPRHHHYTAFLCIISTLTLV